MTTASFTHGSTMRHVSAMSGTAAIGLLAIFLVDLVDIYFLGLLGEAEIAAAIGYAGSILFFTTSINIGSAIATGALTAQALGREQQAEAKQIATNSIVFASLFAIALSIIVWFAIPTLLQLLGATGRTLSLAISYLQILIPSMTLLAIGMCGSSVLRATGDAKGAMYVTLLGGLVNLVLDPLFIFAFGWGVDGAAWASVAARTAICCYAMWTVIYKHSLLGNISFESLVKDIRSILSIAIPSMLTNIITPLGNAYVIVVVSSFGDSAVAGMSIIGRLTPVAFCLIFALSGAIGPIVGQNFGAQKFNRVRSTLLDSLKFSAAVVVTTSILLFLLQDLIVSAFNATDEARDMIKVFCTWVAMSFLFTGMTFISNAAFNNLGYPLYSTVSNLSKAIIFTVPMVYLGALWGGHEGILIGQAIGSTIVGLITFWFCVRLIKKLEDSSDDKPDVKDQGIHPRFPRWPMSNIRS